MSIRFSRAGASNVANEDPEENSPCCKIFSFFSQSKHFTSTISKVFLFRPPQKKGFFLFFIYISLHFKKVTSLRNLFLLMVK